MIAINKEAREENMTKSLPEEKVTNTGTKIQVTVLFLRKTLLKD